VHHYNSTQY